MEEGLDETNLTSDNADTSEDQKDESSSATKQKSFIARLKNNRSRRASAKRSYRLDLFCFVLILIFASYFKASHYQGQKTDLLYYYEDAIVIDTREVSTEDGKRQRVAIQYEVGSSLKRKYLYFKKDPALIVGDTVKLKIQTINPNNIEIEGM